MPENMMPRGIFGSRIEKGLSQWLSGVRHELSSLSRTLGSWVRIRLTAWMSCVRLFRVCVVLYVGNGLATG
jgi:hypothetical protein